MRIPHPESTFRPLVRATCVVAAFAQLGCGFGADTPAPSDVTRQSSPLTVSNTAGTSTLTPRDWRAAVKKGPTQGKGCYHISYPESSWTQVPCAPASTRPAQARVGGSGTPNEDGIVFSNSHLIAQAYGSFDSVSGITTETNSGGSADTHSNAFSLQMNSGYQLASTSAPACNNASPPTGTQCKSWQQFLYYTDGSTNAAQLVIETWVKNYNNSTGSTCVGEGSVIPSYCCPDSSWLGTGNDCLNNGPILDSGGSGGLLVEPISNLYLLELSGYVTSTTDTVTFFDANANEGYGEGWSTTADDSLVSLSKWWNGGGYNVYGYPGGQAVFADTPQMSVNIDLTYTDGSFGTPGCNTDPGTALTGESNNLTIVNGSCCNVAMPAVYFYQSYNGAATGLPFCLMDAVPFVTSIN